MIKLFVIAAIILCSTKLFAQIGLGITTPHPNAYFQINSTNKGVLLPRMTAVQRLTIAPAATANGLIVFDTDSSAYMFWTGTLWRKIGGDDGNWVKSGDNIYNSNTGNVGIGTSTPLARLHVADSAVLFGSSTFNIAGITQLPPVQGSGVRMMWYPQRAAFRAGVVDDGTFIGVPGLYDSKIWDRDSIGIYSFAAGYNSKAKGQGDVVMGLLNESTGSASAVFGTENKSYGYSNFSAGRGNTAYGNYNISMGEINNTSGNHTIAIGKNNLVSDSGIVMGTMNETGIHSNIALGQYNKALGIYTTTIGFGNRANQIYSLAAGYNSTANRQGTVAIGMNNFAGGEFSSAFGYSNIANSPGCTVVGMFNNPFDDITLDRIFQVGNGSSLSGRSNAMTILKNGNVGIGTVTPDATLNVVGNINLQGGYLQFVNGTEGIGRVLASDISGRANWTDPSILWPGFWQSNGTDIYNNNTGNVGIGTSTPNSPLSFANTLGNKISLWGSNSASNYGLGVQGSLLQLYVPGTTDNIAFGTGGSNSFTERMRIQGNGNVGIGLTNPGSILHVNNGTVRFEGAAFSGTGNAAVSIGGYGSVLVDAPGLPGSRFTIQEDGNTGIGNNDPAFVLDVNNRMRIRSGGDASNTAGIWLNSTDNSAVQSFIGIESDNTMGFYGSGSGWSFTMNTNTGKIKIADGTQAADRILSCDASGIASWVNSSAIKSAISAAFPATGGVNLTTAAGTVYTNLFIDLPAGKWVVIGTYLMAQGGSSLLSGQSMFIRTSFSSSPAANVSSGDNIGSGLISGHISFPTPFAIINGQNIINNTSVTIKRYYVWADMTNTGGQPAGFFLNNFNGNFWSENNLVAIPMN